ncbi:MAG: CDP-alcohol phosphatidyltransferase family protein [Steroidobacteraceae bacterium]
MNRWLRQIPNVITSLRILLVIPIALALLRGNLITTLALFFAAAVSDAADGFLAKRFGWRTTLGGILDPAADKLLLATVFIVLAVLHWVPGWLMAAAVARDVVIVLGAIAYRLCFGPITARPSVVSKLNTLFQAFYILSVIGREQFRVPPAWMVLALGALTFVTIVISGMDYVLRYGQAALHEAHARSAGLTADRSRLT